MFQPQVEGTSDAHSCKLLARTTPFHPWGHELWEHGGEAEPEAGEAG